MPYCAPLADMPMISTAPRLAEMNARPVTHAGSERPDRKKSRLVETERRADEADAEHEDEVDRDQQVVDPAEVEAQHVLCSQCRGGPSHLSVINSFIGAQHKFGQKTTRN